MNFIPAQRIVQLALYTVYSRGDSMIFKISWATDPCWPGTVWFLSGMVPSCQINFQMFGKSIFGKIITKKSTQKYSLSIHKS